MPRRALFQHFPRLRPRPRILLRHEFQVKELYFPSLFYFYGSCSISQLFVVYAFTHVGSNVLIFCRHPAVSESLNWSSGERFDLRAFAIRIRVLALKLLLITLLGALLCSYSWLIELLDRERG